MRDVMSSFWKTLRRWYWTVRWLMKSCAPISGLERPSWASRGDLCFLGCERAAGFVGAFARGLAGGLELATGALGKGLSPEAAERFVSGAELLASVNPAIFAA